MGSASGRPEKSDEQRRAEADVEDFHKHLGPFVVAAEATHLPMVFTNAKAPGNPIIFANDAFLRLTGYCRDEVLAQSFDFLMATGGDAKALVKLKEVFDGISYDGLEIHYRRKDGSEFWASMDITPVKDCDGEIVQHFISLVDLTKKQHEQARALMFIDELNHRVKNTLATVQAITWQAFRSESGVANIRNAIESRLFALSRSHDLLTLAHWEGVGLRDLLNTILEPFANTSGRSQRIVVAGDNLRLSPNTTLALAIGFHELATNAAKYGALSNEAGSLLITWAIEQRDEEERLVLRWRETDGPLVTPPTHKGFGSDVIEHGLEYELAGEVDLDYRPEGVVCTIDIPAKDIRLAP